MKLMEEKAIDTFHKMWANWKDTSDFQMGKYLINHHKDFKGFGSGLTEVWRKQDDMRTYSEGMIDRGFKGFTVTSKWLEANEISPGLVCLWGDTVNLASRMESASLPNKINISAYTYELIRAVYPCEYRDKIDTKDRGKLEMYFVN